MTVRFRREVDPVGGPALRGGVHRVHRVHAPSQVDPGSTWGPLGSTGSTRGTP